MNQKITHSAGLIPLAWDGCNPKFKCKLYEREMEDWRERIQSTGSGKLSSSSAAKGEREEMDEKELGPPTYSALSRQPPGASSLSCRSRWRDTARPMARHASAGQTCLPACLPLSRQRMWRDKVVLSRPKGLWDSITFFGTVNIKISI
jgi:hypothetical protein